MANNNSALARGLKVLECVAQAQRGLNLSELMAELSLPKPTLHRLASQLEESGYLQRSPDKRFVIGAALKQLAFNVFSNQSVVEARHAILQALSNDVGETCNCTLMDGHEIVYFDRVESNWPIKVDLRPGSKLPIHATASGKLFLACMKPQECRRLLQSIPLKRYTKRTLVDIAELEKALQHIRETGVGSDDEELFEGMAAIAVPVFDAKERICFTVAIHTLTTRKTLADLWQYIPRLHQAADALAASYAYPMDKTS